MKRNKDRERRRKEPQTMPEERRMKRNVSGKYAKRKLKKKRS
jgi:hypothetical protein